MMTYRTIPSLFLAFKLLVCKVFSVIQCVLHVMPKSMLWMIPWHPAASAKCFKNVKKIYLHGFTFNMVKTMCY